MAGVVVIDVAFVVAQVKVVLCPALTNSGLAVNCVTVGGVGPATSTVAVCGELVPCAFLAVAVYVVVWVGESVTLPDCWELVVSVRVAEPAVAVMVTEVASTACQFSVTACPASIAPALAEKTSSGALPPLSPLQPDNDNKATGIAPHVSQRKIFLLIFGRSTALPKNRAKFRCRVRLRSWSHSAAWNQWFT
jgi:hypothetical protein